MTAICHHVVDHPSAWTPSTIHDKSALKLALSEDELVAIESLLSRTRHLRPQEVTRADFDHPVVNGLLDRVRDVIMNGRGILIVSGVTPDRFDPRDFERIYWGFGTHLGIGAVQSGNGDRLGYVQNNPADEVKRGYRSLRELHMHTDSYEVVGLMCVRRAKSGGLSGLAPSLSIHNEILRTRPDLLAPLYRGFRIASEEARFSTKAVTDDAMPVFSYVDGKLSCMYEPSHMKNAAEILGGMPGDLAEALDVFDSIANREDMALRFLLEPGDMMLWHNYTNLHSRTSFEDDPASPRLLLRLWLSVPHNGRPADPRFRMRAETYERIYRERLANAS